MVNYCCVATSLDVVQNPEIQRTQLPLHRYLPSDAEPLLQPREREIPTHQALKGYTKILINIE